MFRYLPIQASENAAKVDWANNLITDLSVFFTVLVVGAMLYFAVKYRRGNSDKNETPRILGSHILELTWTIIPSIISAWILYIGIIYYQDLRRVPEGALEISVVGQKWKWDFEYGNGKKSYDKLVIPVDTPVKLILSSKDVLHSFFIPAMRVKSDVVPGHFTYVTFTPNKTGEYHIFCTEYCGREHWNMINKLKVVSKAEYNFWLIDKSDELRANRMSAVDRGKLAYTQYGCNACHSLDGSRLVGPSFLNSYARTAEFTEGESLTVDENYIQESIYYPSKKIVKGYPAGLMPAFEGQINADEMKGLIAFIKSIDGSTAKTPVKEKKEEIDLTKLTSVQRGKILYNEKVCATCHSLDGSKLIGPSFQGLYNRKGKLADGSDYIADDDYIKNSILNSAAQIVEGYPAAMPSYQGQLDDGQVTDLLDYIKTIK